MIKNTFLHIPGIGAKTEERIWESGFTRWQGASGAGQYKISPKQMEVIENHTRQSLENISGNNPKYFADLLPAGEHWRLFSEFRHSTAYIDIETTGLEKWENEITTIALYDGKNIFYYVQGQNLDEFMDDIQKYSLIVTYNGKTFDQPFIEEYFNTELDHAHIDLRYVLKSLGYSGGLKNCEKALGIDRGDLNGVDGFFAVLLWQDYQENQNEKALETLLAYNIEDVLNLETLMVTAYNMKLKKTPFYSSHILPIPRLPRVPFSPDPGTIRQIKKRSGFRTGSFF